jgi:hypothetical protein
MLLSLLNRKLEPSLMVSRGNYAEREVLNGI